MHGDQTVTMHRVAWRSYRRDPQLGVHVFDVHIEHFDTLEEVAALERTVRYRADFRDFYTYPVLVYLNPPADTAQEAA